MIIILISIPLHAQDYFLVFNLFSKSMQMDELACFAPGMLALGSFGYGPEESQKFLSLAEEVVA